MVLINPITATMGAGEPLPFEDVEPWWVCLEAGLGDGCLLRPARFAWKTGEGSGLLSVDMLPSRWWTIILALFPKLLLLLTEAREVLRLDWDTTSGVTERASSESQRRRSGGSVLAFVNGRILTGVCS